MSEILFTEIQFNDLPETVRRCLEDILIVRCEKSNPTEKVMRYLITINGQLHASHMESLISFKKLCKGYASVGAGTNTCLTIMFTIFK